MRNYDTNSGDSKLDRQAEYTNRTGLCPICHVRPSRHGITCGDWACMNHFLPGGDKSLKINTTDVRLG